MNAIRTYCVALVMGLTATSLQSHSVVADDAPSNTDTPKPNIVVIFTDDQGYGDLSCFGGTHVSTPRIDQMAAEGARLTSFYVAAPVCTPSRAALMTGCYPKRVSMGTGSRHGVLLSADKKGLNPNEITIAEVLKSAGYKTGMFGKWHLGDLPEFLPSGSKGTTLEGGMREPTVIRWPGHIVAGQDNNQLMTAMDLLPTFARLAGAEIPSDRMIDGKDVSSVLFDQQESPHEAFFYHHGNSLQAVRSGKWKLHLKGIQHKGRQKKHARKGQAALFDLEADIGEKYNVAANHPKVVARLQEMAKDFQAELAENSRPAGFVKNPLALTKSQDRTSGNPARGRSE